LRLYEAGENNEGGIGAWLDESQREGGGGHVLTVVKGEESKGKKNARGTFSEKSDRGHVHILVQRTQLEELRIKEQEILKSPTTA